MWSPEPVSVMRGKRAVSVACSTYSTLVRTDAGHVWSWGAHGVNPAPPTRVRLGGSACALAAAGSHFVVALGDAPPDSTDCVLARKVGFEMPPSRVRSRSPCWSGKVFMPLR